MPSFCLNFLSFNNNEIESICKEIIIDLSINDFGGMGQVMNELKNKFAGRIDMKKASTLVKKILSKNIK